MMIGPCASMVLWRDSFLIVLKSRAMHGPPSTKKKSGLARIWFASIVRHLIQSLTKATEKQC